MSKIIIQTIFRTTPDSNFTQIENDLAGTPMRYKAKDVLIYLLTKPPFWKVIKADICKQLELSPYIVKKSLQWLRKNSYAFFIRLKTGHAIWKIFDRPQAKTAETPAIIPKVVMPSVALPTVLETIDVLEIQKEQQHEPILDPEPIPELIQEPVVVSSETIVLEYPPQLTPDQLKNAKHTIKKCKDAAKQPEVLFALAYYVSKGGVKNPCAYLAGLVRDANNGTFEPIQADSASKQTKPLIPYWQGHKDPPKIDNEAHIQSLAKQYPERSAAINKALPVRCFADFKSNLNLGVAAL